MLNPPLCTSPTMPMICRTGSSLNSRWIPRPIDDPILQRIVVFPKLLGHRLIDDHHRQQLSRRRDRVNVRPRFTGILNDLEKTRDPPATRHRLR